MIRIGLATLGCKANQSDTAALRDAIGAQVGDEVSFARGREWEGLDLVVVNTCTVTHTADADARQIVRRYRRNNPDAQIVVTGCYAQTDADALRAMPEIDHVVGNIQKAQLPGMVARLLQGESPERPFVRPGNRDWNPTLRDATAIRRLPAGQSRPFLKVQDGCNYVCSFCIIPAARGESRSVSLEEVAAQARRYEALGAREIVLTGIHLGHWGRDLEPKRRFGEMVRALLDRTEHARLRISSLEPNEVDRDVLDLVATHPRVCPHLHVPLQSGDDHILGQMRRVYRAPMYRQLVKKFRSCLPSGAWGADVMVGFPGETDAQFENTVTLLDEADVTYLHVFPYSPRRGTPAATMPNPVPPPIQRQRVNRLKALSERQQTGHVARAVGTEGLVLVEERRVNGALRGYSENYVAVSLDGPDEWMNELVPVQIMSADGMTARGKAI